MGDPQRPSWYRPAGGYKYKPSRASLAGARVRTGSHQLQGTNLAPIPVGRGVAGREVAEAYAVWLESKGMQLFGTVSTKYPLSIGQHVQVGRLLQDTYQVATGERPTVMVPCQRNPSRQGYHSHPSLFGSVALQGPRRDVIWVDVMSRLTNEPGMGVETVSALVGRDRLGEFHWRHYEEHVDGSWLRLSEANEGRFRLEPVTSHADALRYSARYASRETDCLEILAGDGWRG